MGAKQEKYTAMAAENTVVHHGGNCRIPILAKGKEYI